MVLIVSSWKLNIHYYGNYLFSREDILLDNVSCRYIFESDQLWKDAQIRIVKHYHAHIIKRILKKFPRCEDLLEDFSMDAVWKFHALSKVLHACIYATYKISMLHKKYMQYTKISYKISNWGVWLVSKNASVKVYNFQPGHVSQSSADKNKKTGMKQSLIIRPKTSVTELIFWEWMRRFLNYNVFFFSKHVF